MSHSTDSPLIKKIAKMKVPPPVNEQEAASLMEIYKIVPIEELFGIEKHIHENFFIEIGIYVRIFFVVEKDKKPILYEVNSLHDLSLFEKIRTVIIEEEINDVYTDIQLKKYNIIGPVVTYQVAFP